MLTVTHTHTHRGLQTGGCHGDTHSFSFPFLHEDADSCERQKKVRKWEFLSMGLSAPDVAVTSRLLYGNRWWKMGNEQSASEGPTQVNDAAPSCSSAQRRQQVFLGHFADRENPRDARERLRQRPVRGRPGPCLRDQR